MQNGSCRGRAGGTSRTIGCGGPAQNPKSRTRCSHPHLQKLEPPQISSATPSTLGETEKGRRIGSLDRSAKTTTCRTDCSFPHSHRFRHLEQRGANNRHATPHETFCTNIPRSNSCRCSTNQTSPLQLSPAMASKAMWEVDPETRSKVFLSPFPSPLLFSYPAR